MTTWSAKQIENWQDADGWWHVPKMGRVRTTLNFDFDFGVVPWLENCTDEEIETLVTTYVREFAAGLTEFGLDIVNENLSDREVMADKVQVLTERLTWTRFEEGDPRLEEAATPADHADRYLYNPNDYLETPLPEYRWVQGNYDPDVPRRAWEPPAPDDPSELCGD